MKRSVGLHLTDCNYFAFDCVEYEKLPMEPIGFPSENYMSL